MTIKAANEALNEMVLPEWLALQREVDRIALGLPYKDRLTVWALRDHANDLKRQLQAVRAAVVA